MPVIGTSSQKKDGAHPNNQCFTTPNSYHSQDSTLPSRMEDVESKLSKILDFIERPAINKKRNSMPNVPKFNGAISRNLRKGSCPAVGEPFTIINQTALKNVKEERKQDEREEEEDYLAPSDIQPALNQPGRKTSKPCGANDSVRMIPALPEEPVVKHQTADEEGVAYISMTDQKMNGNDQGSTSTNMANNGKQMGRSTVQDINTVIPANKGHKWATEEEIGEDRDEADTVYQVMRA